MIDFSVLASLSAVLSRAGMGKAKDVFVVVGKAVLILTCLYFFICSLSFLSDSFRLLGGRNLGGESGLGVILPVIDNVLIFSTL